MEFPIGAKLELARNVKLENVNVSFFNGNLLFEKGREVEYEGPGALFGQHWVIARDIVTTSHIVSALKFIVSDTDLDPALADKPEIGQRVELAETVVMPDGTRWPAKTACIVDRIDSPSYHRRYRLFVTSHGVNIRVQRQQFRIVGPAVKPRRKGLDAYDFKQGEHIQIVEGRLHTARDSTGMSEGNGKWALHDGEPGTVHRVISSKTLLIKIRRHTWKFPHYFMVRPTEVASVDNTANNIATIDDVAKLTPSWFFLMYKSKTGLKHGDYQYRIKQDAIEEAERIAGEIHGCDVHLCKCEDTASTTTVAWANARK